MMVHNPKNSQKIMLWCLESALGLIFNAVKNSSERLTRADMGRQFRENTAGFAISNRQASQMLYDLKRRDYISFGEGDSVILTNKAKIKIIDRVVENDRKDGKYRLVSFDIPEPKRQNRDNFRRAIKRMGFRQIQKSLWACEYNIGDLVEAAAVEYKVTDYVAYFVSDKSNIDKHIASVLDKN